MTQIKSRKNAMRKSATTNDRNFLSFLLVAQLEAKAIGSRIAQARNEQGMTQEEMCELTTFSKRSLSDYENGVTIPYKHLREISSLLGREVPWFLHGEEPAKPDVVERLAALEERVDLLPTKEELQRGLDALRAAIDAQASQDIQTGSG